MGTPTQEILVSIPQRDPFLFIDEVVDRQEDRVITRFHVTGDEPFFKGHFPGNPIMPGVLLQEAAFQSGALLMSKKGAEGLGVVARVQDCKFKNFVKPGDVLEMEVTLDEKINNAFYMSAKTRVEGKVVMTLKFTGMSTDQ